MPLFRFHRGGLSESLATTIIVKTLKDVVKAIVCSPLVLDENPPWGAKFYIEPYPSKNNNFDSRICWYSHIVTTNLYEEGKMHVVGFLSEPLK
jgi:hypothetical protein